MCLEFSFCDTVKNEDDMAILYFELKEKFVGILLFIAYEAI